MNEYSNEWNQTTVDKIIMLMEEIAQIRRLLSRAMSHVSSENIVKPT